MPKVLIVDDDRTTVKLLQTLLMMDGFEVSMCARGAEALTIAHREVPDIFLIDHNLSDMSGQEVIQALRADPQFATAPIVMASGLNVEAEAKAAGADLFLFKPLEPNTLGDTLYSLL
ncbi:MAG: response regulator [Anaerolineae bacterium]|nr:response regulator [Anaerolineae bacterium]